MTKAWDALRAASQLRHQFIGDAGYGLAYGSHPAGTATPVLGGNVALYDEHRRRAERALALLALSRHGGTVITLAGAARAVTEGPNGASGKDFLGYIQGPHLCSTLHRGLARLAADGIVRELDGEHFEHDPAARRAAIVQLRSHLVAERDSTSAPGTIASDEGGMCQ